MTTASNDDQSGVTVRGGAGALRPWHRLLIIAVIVVTIAIAVWLAFAVHVAASRPPLRIENLYLVAMAVTARFIQQLVRFGAVFGLAALGLMTHLGMAFIPDTCPRTGVTCQIPNVAIVQPSLLNRFGLLVHGYWPAAVLAAVVVTGVTAAVGMRRVSRDREVAQNCLRRVYC